MADPDWLRLQALFDAALELPEAEQEPFARRACADDPALGEQLLRLLRRQRRQHVLADEPVIGGLDAVLRDAIPDAFLEGRQVGTFHITELIGDGGMGRVYAAQRRDGEICQEVAIKLVRSELMNPALLRRFSTERRVLAALNHPGICRFIDAGTLGEGTPYVVLERVHGQPLLDYCDQHGLDIAQRLRLFRKVLAAVEHAHQSLVVHRDIKSGNVLVDAQGEPKLLDFGIAKSLAEGPSDARTGTAERFFTPGSAAPEQLRGEPVGVGCDIYALGALAYELLCGKPPFDVGAQSAGELWRQVLEVPPPLPSQCALEVDPAVARRRGLASGKVLARQLSGDLDAVVARCLRKAPQERYASVEQLDDDIGRWLAHRPVHARRGDRLYRMRKFVTRHRLAVALVGALLLTVLAGTTIVVRQSLSLASQRNEALQQRDRAQQAMAILKHAFLAADPSRAAGGDTPVREVLAAAAPQLEASFAAQPAVYAELAQTLAEVHLALGMEPTAAELSRRAALALRQSGAAESAVHRQQSFSALAFAGAGDYEAAQAALAAAETPTPSALWLTAKGRLLRVRGDYAGSLQVSEQAVALLQGAAPQDEIALLARIQVAEAHKLAGRTREALQAFDDTLQWLGTELPQNHPSVLRTRLRRAEALRQDGRAAAAVEEVNRVAKSVIATYGPHSSFAALTHAVAAIAHADLDQREQAIARHRQALEAWQQSLGAHHPNALRTRFNLANSLAQTSTGQAEADQHYRDAIDAAAATLGPSAASTLHFRSTYARWLLRRGDAGQALAVLQPDGGLPNLQTASAALRDGYLAVWRSSAAAACGHEPSDTDATACGLNVAP